MFSARASYSASASGFITEAIVAINAIKATGATLSNIQEISIDTLFRAFILNGTWDKYLALYLFVGGTANAHALNIKNPGTYSILWDGSIVHDANGVTFDGVTGYGNTQFSPSLCDFATAHMSIYNRVALSASITNEMGVQDNTANGRWSLALRQADNLLYSTLYGGGGVATYATIDIGGVSTGHFVTNRIGTSEHSAYRNGTKLVTAARNVTAIPVLPIFIGALNNSGVISRYSNCQLAFCSIGYGFTDWQIAADYAAIQAFQTALGRAA